MITQSECRELLSYCPETGEFRWRVDRNFTELRSKRTKPQNGG